MTGRGKAAVIISAVVVLLLIGTVGVVSWIIGASGSAPAERAEETTAPPSSGAQNADDQPSEEDAATAAPPGAYAVEVDSRGLAAMPLTSDPREAAAAAAVIAFSADASQVTHDEYTAHAIREMTLFQREFVGPGDEEALNISTVDGWLQEAPFSRLISQVLGWQSSNESDWNWWELSQQSAYSILSTTEAKWSATPIAVNTVADIEAMGLRAPSRAPEQNWRAITPGASLADYWVRARVEESMRGSVYRTSTRVAVVSIWCDAPADGGNCGVVEIVDGPIPPRWQE